MHENLKKVLNILGGIFLIIVGFALIIFIRFAWDDISNSTLLQYFFIGIVILIFIAGLAALYDGLKKKKEVGSEDITIKPKEQIKTISGPAGTIAEFNSTSQQCRFWEGLSMKGRLYSYSDIVAFELIENGESIISGGLGSAVVGGLLLGWGGAIVGGVTATRKSREKCVSLKVKITVNNMDKPTIFLTFIDKYSAVEKSSSKYEKYLKQAHECISNLQLICERHNVSAKSPQTGDYELLTTQDAPYTGMIFLQKNGVLQYITHPDVFSELQLDSSRVKNVSANAISVYTRGADLQTQRYLEEESRRTIDSSRFPDSETTPISKPNLNIITADEIRKLKDLRDEGVITKKEFKTAKRNLLGM